MEHFNVREFAKPSILL